MPKRLAGIALLLSAGAFAQVFPSAVWNPPKAAAYLDQRAAWWMNWPRASRDHQTFCISCHTAVPYALSRPALRGALGEQSPSPNEQKLLENVVKRVRLWPEVAPFYPDQTVGLPKTSESRGTESILNALLLVWNDAPSRKLSPDARAALDNMWALQLRSGDMSGSWAWLQFHNAPWEGDSQFYGATLAALAVGSAPADYQSEEKIQPGLKLLRAWLTRNRDSQTLADRLVLLWASAKLPGLLTASQQQAIVDQTLSKQQPDGGFSLSSLVGAWKRVDNTPLDTTSDGYATGLVALALETTGHRESAQSALAWLAHNQNPADGRWPASSLNKLRALESDAGRFMSDAATAYAVLALESK